MAEQLTPRERIYAKALMKIIDALAESDNGRDFLSRICNDNELDQVNFYKCEWCGQHWKGADCKFTWDGGHIICNRCSVHEHDLLPKEGE